MKRLKDKYIFKQVNDLYICINEEGVTLAEFLKELNIIVDDICTFARFYDPYIGVTYTYRVLNFETIDIRIHYDEE